MISTAVVAKTGKCRFFIYCPNKTWGYLVKPGFFPAPLTAFLKELAKLPLNDLPLCE